MLIQTKIIPTLGGKQKFKDQNQNEVMKSQSTREIQMLGEILK
jgi:hypothetical protein